MANYVVQCQFAGMGAMHIPDDSGAVAYQLTSGADGTLLTGTGDYLLIYADAAGWFHVSETSASDKAASLKTFRIPAPTGMAVFPIGGVGKGKWISFLADA